MLSQTQRALLAELAAHLIADLNFRKDSHRRDCTDVVFWHGGECMLENACAILRKLHLADPVDEATGIPHADRDQWSMQFRLVKIGQAAEVLAAHENLPGIVVDEALSALLDLKVNYGASPLTATRAAFAVPPGFEQTFELLRACGFAETEGDKVRWTKRCAWAMRKAFLWDDENESCAEVEAMARDDEARQMLASMPSDVRRYAVQGDVISLAGLISRRWRDGRWRVLPAQGEWRGEAVLLARRVVELINHKPG